MELSVQIETANLTWAGWKRIVAAVERLGYAGLYLCDHFAAPGPVDFSLVSIDAWAALTYLADHSERLRFGPLVSPLSFRDPVALARQAMNLDDLSGGRFVLGVGAGWVEREHEMFGWVLGDAKTRMGRLTEGLEVITRLCRAEPPVSFQGRFYVLRDARLLPRSPRPGGPEILLGSRGGNRSLALAAHYADAFNTTSRSADDLADIYRRLDARLDARGRAPSAVRRTVMANVLPWRTDAELALQTRFGRTHFNPENLSPREFAARKRDKGDFVGSPDEVVDQIRAAAALGVQEIMVNTIFQDEDDLESLEVVAGEVMPRL